MTEHSYRKTSTFYAVVGGYIFITAFLALFCVTTLKGSTSPLSVIGICLAFLAIVSLALAPLFLYLLNHKIRQFEDHLVEIDLLGQTKTKFQFSEIERIVTYQRAENLHIVEVSARGRVTRWTSKLSDWQTLMEVCSLKGNVQVERV